MALGPILHCPCCFRFAVCDGFRFCFRIGTGADACGADRALLPEWAAEMALFHSPRSKTLANIFDLQGLELNNHPNYRGGRSNLCCGKAAGRSSLMRRSVLYAT